MMTTWLANARISGAALPWLPACGGCIAIIHAID